MKHWEVTQFLRELTILANYLQTLVNEKGEPAPCRNFSLNYAIQKNFTRFTKAVELIDKSIDPELTELEQKASKSIEKTNAEIKEKNKTAEDKIPLLTIMDGLKKLTKEEQKKHTALMEVYNKAMEEENEVETYKVKAEKIEDVPMELAYMPILDKMVD